MKFTSEDLMKAMGLAIGDKVIMNGKTHTFTTKKDGTLICKNVLKQLIDQDFEILPRPKRVGDLECNMECNNCPLIAICAMYDTFEQLTLYEVLERNNSMASDQEIHDLLKARLDKEVVEE